MSNPTVTSATQADLMYMPKGAFYSMTAKPEIQPVLPPQAPNGGTRHYNERQSIILMAAGSMVRSGMKFPLAARWACRIAEQLLFDPDAARVHIEFRRNGALFCFTSDDAPEAAEAAGPVHFRTTFDLDAYRAAFRAALTDA